MPPPACLTAVSGSSPIVLIAPHGGRRDPALRPWVTGRLRVNDLHTAALTAELAAALDAAALINAEQDRNEVDLNRISRAHERAPWFLLRLAELLDAILARHGRATVLVIHGWNVVQPIVDLGLGCAPAADPRTPGAGAAVSPAFAAKAVPALVEACASRGILTTVGARYPACHRENLLQLFTPRYRDDRRPLVRALAAMADRVDAMQLELGIPLRWPGAWRPRLVAACRTVLADLVAPAAGARATSAPPASAAATPPPARLEFTSPTLCGLAGVDTTGGRLLLFLPTGDLALFTGERVGLAAAAVDGLVFQPTTGAGHQVRFRGPLLHFPDTTPFLDLESGLAGARLGEGDVRLDFSPDETTAAGPGGFGRVSGSVTLDGVSHLVGGHGFVHDGAAPEVWPRLRAALRLVDDTRLVLTLGLPDGLVDGFVRCGDRREPVVRARATVANGDSPLERFVLEVELAGGRRFELVAHALHRLPVIRAHRPTPLRLEFAACRLEGSDGAPAGWCEVGGL